MFIRLEASAVQFRVFEIHAFLLFRVFQVHEIVLNYVSEVHEIGKAAPCADQSSPLSNHGRQRTPHVPLLIRGARRVGKTYAAEEIGRRIAGDAFVKLDFQTDLELIAPLFDCPTDDVDTIVARISDYKRAPIRKETTFILFDEVQLCERALNSLRIFFGFGLAHMRDRQSARRRHAQT